MKRTSKRMACLLLATLMVLVNLPIVFSVFADMPYRYNYGTNSDYLTDSDYGTGSDYLTNGDYGTPSDYVTPGDYLTDSDYEKYHDYIYGDYYRFDENYVTRSDYSYRFYDLYDDIVTLTYGNVTVEYCRPSKIMHIYGSGAVPDDFARNSGCYPNVVIIEDGITKIGNYAFQYCYGLTSITIPDSVTSIGNRAFSWCSGLTNITIGSGVTSIGEYAFYCCSKLKTVYNYSALNITKGATNYGYIGYYADNVYNYHYTLSDAYSVNSYMHQNTVNLFSNAVYLTSSDYGEQEYCGKCGENAYFEFDGDTLRIYGSGKIDSYCLIDFCFKKTVESLVIEEGISEIGDYAFSNIHIKSLSLPDSLTKIGTSAFYYSCIEGQLVLSENVVFIGENAFRGNRFDSLVLLHDDLTTINRNYYSEYEHNFGYVLRQEYHTVSRILYYSFSSCIALSEVKIPNCSDIPERSFLNCRGLEKVTFLSDNIKLGDYAFSDCAELTEIVGDNNITKIGESAFYNCKSLIKLCLTDYTNIIYEYSIDRNVIIYAPTYSTAYFYALENGNPFVSTGYATQGSYNGKNGYWKFNNGELYIGFDEYLTDIPASSAYASVPWYYYRDKITMLTLEEGIESIGAYAFSKMVNLRSVSLPSTVKTIAEGAFSDCRYLTSITVPDGIFEIQSRVFSNCNNLEEISIPSSIVSIGDYAFYRCLKLKEIDLKNVIYIGNYAFSKCSRLETVNTGSRLSSIGECAFQSTTIKNLKLPGNVSFIDCEAFLGNDNISFLCPADSYAQSYAEENGIEYYLYDEVRYDASDLAVLMKKLLNGDTNYDSAYDINDDGKIDLLDLIALKKNIAKTAVTKSADIANNQTVADDTKKNGIAQ